MPSPKGDPCYIKNKEQYFIEVAKTVALSSTHPKAPGGCILVRDRSIIGDGRSLLTHSKVEVDCISYAIATACKRGVPSVGADIYSTRYPFSASVFQAYVMGVRRITVLAHEWEPFYKDEFRRAARLAREVGMAIEPYYEIEERNFAVNTNDNDRTNKDELFPNANDFRPDEYDGADEPIDYPD